MNSMDDPKLVEVLTRMETKLDAFIDKSNDHETRIRSLEKRVWAIPSAGLLLEILGTVIMYLSIHH